MTRPLHLLLVLCLACVAHVALTRTAHADDPALRAAKRHYERGQKLFALQKFDEALDQFQKAFDAKPIPDFLFNIGQCQRNLGDYEAAVFSFKRYLKLDPDASNREKVEELIAQLEEKLASQDARQRGLRPDRSDKPDKPDKPDRPAEAGRPFYKQWWFWTGVAVVGVAGGVGYYATTAGGPPDTSLGRNIVFGK
ncbi:MAG TPA: tetratricopeptide repeat protein [Kofleriaceae bacterium]|nr:tetratricopeptide repeat protein [Kofleriaceae bacterium]